jgi:Ca2+-binding RTX toxin-like protein
MPFPGSEFVVNTGTDGEQLNPSQTVLSDGRILVTWCSLEDDGLEVRGRYLDADGTPLGDDFLINTTPTEDINAPTVTALADGSAFVAWIAFIPSTGEFEIRGRIINADGTGGPDFIVNSTTVNEQFTPSATTLADGRILVTWTSNEGDGSILQYDIRGRILEPDGTPSGPDFVINSSVSGTQNDVNVLALDDGRALATWTSTDPDTNVITVFGRFINSDGTMSASDFRILPVSEHTQTESSLTALANGSILVTWVSLEADTSSNVNIHGRILGADGSVIVSDFIVNSNLDGGQISPTATTLADGRVLVVWESINFETGDSDIYGRILGPDGFPIGEDFLINVNVGLTERAPYVEAMADGRIVITWTAFDATTGSSEIYARILALDAVIDGTPGNDQIVGTNDDDVILAAAGKDIVYGGLGNDALYGDDGNDLLFGEAGNDYLAGGDGNDRLWGNEGNDTFVGGRGADEMAGGTGIDTVRYDASPTGVNVNLWFNQGTFGDAAGDKYWSIETVIGSRFADTLIGDGASNNLFGGGGRDDLYGGVGNDVLDGGEDDDNVAGETGNDVVRGGAGNDRLWGNEGNDTLIGGAGADVIAGGVGVDTADYSASPGGVTVDLRFGTATGSGGDAEGDTLSMIENLIGSDYDDYLVATIASAQLTGGAGDDFLLGNSGNDRLDGGAGNDVLTGSDRGDVLIGGTGADTFEFVLFWDSEIGREDQITDFSSAEGDRINLSSMDANSNTSGTNEGFTYLGAAEFTGTAGELRFADHVLEGDVNGDGFAEFRIHLNVASLSELDLVL